MIVKEIYQFDSGGIVYKDVNGVILGTGTAQDSAAPDPGNLEGVFLYCQSPARTLYISANQSFTYRVKNSLAITTTPNRDQLLTILSQNFFFRVSGGVSNLSQLSDVSLSILSNGEVLIYDLIQSKWENNFLNLASTIYTNKYINEASTQWSKTLGAPVALANGQTANGFTFFDDTTDRVSSGCTAYNEYFISYTRKLTLTGTSGTANINIDGVNYLAVFNTTLTQTAIDFVAIHGAVIFASSGITVAANNGILRFGYTSDALLNAITITNVAPNLGGTFDTSINDHVVVPYVGEPYENLRLTHQFRVNFNIVTGTTQTLALSLRRWADDSIIGSEIQVQRNPDVSGVQENFISYTASASDPFVIGGFYFALRNDSGTSVDISGTVGVLIITTFQKPVNF